MLIQRPADVLHIKSLDEQTVEVIVRTGTGSGSFVLARINADSLRVGPGDPSWITFRDWNNMPFAINVFSPAEVIGVGS